MFPGLRKRGSGETVEKPLRVFPTKGLRSAARIICPSMTDKFHTGSLSCIFSHAHVARENDLISLPPAGGKLCEAFLICCPDPRKRGSGLFFCNKGNEGRGAASAPTKGLPIGFRRGRCPHRPASVTRGAEERAGKSAKRRQWRKKRADFEEVPRLAATTVAGNRLARRWATAGPYGRLARSLRGGRPRGSPLRRGCKRCGESGISQSRLRRASPFRQGGRGDGRKQRLFDTIKPPPGAGALKGVCGEGGLRRGGLFGVGRF